MNNHRKNILLKGYFAGVFLLIFAFSVSFKLLEVQFFKPDQYKKYVQSSTLRKSQIKAKRGNLYSDNGSLIATSITEYDIYLDPYSIKDNLFDENIDALSDSLENLFYKPSYYFNRKISIARENGVQYMLLIKGLNHEEFNRIKKFPILEKGQNKGGLIVERKSVRVNAAKDIAGRTIGFDDQRGKAGLEGAYSNFLKGSDGARIEQRITAKDWKPINIWNEKEPIDGADVYTTINLDIQNISYSALEKQLHAFDADHGCVVIMEVKTGEIKAMVNLQKTAQGVYKDLRNFAIWEANEPGSTFKTVSLLIAMEHEYINPNTVIHVGDGKLKLFGRTVRDTHPDKKDLTISEVLEQSSNVGTAKVIYTYYHDDPSEFIDQIKEWNLHQKLEIEIPGEGEPHIPDPDDKDWNRITLPWMAYGYSLKLTPLQILTFYNAIANDGVMLKPLFVKKIMEKGVQEKVSKPEIINKKIAKPEAIKQIQKMLENVFVKGTAKDLAIKDIALAGKTGTTQAEYWKKGTRKYRSSFAGYFPANDPKYSCIVVISEPNTSKGYYGGMVAGPVFSEIAGSLTNLIPQPIPDSIQVHPNKPILSKSKKRFAIRNYPIMPNLKGYFVKDVVPVFENLGVTLKYEGVGKILWQSIAPGERFNKKSTLYIKAQ
jgi:cell division protein FtsI (penicillin-binding protein 3)